MAETNRPIASFSEDKKSDTPLPVEADSNPSYEASFDEFAGAWAKGDAGFFAERGADYDRFRAAYEFGAKIAGDKRFAEQSWVTTQGRLRADWEKRTQAPWDEAAPQIQRGWNEARGEG